MARIALIDDHSFFRMGAEAAVRAAGHEVVLSTGDTDTIVETIKAANPDVVLLDQRMAPKDGVSILTAMRKAGDERAVIMLTNELEDDALLGIMKARVNGIVFKHCSEERLFEALSAVATGHRFIDGDLIDKALSLNSKAEQGDGLQTLSQREREIALLVGKGMKNWDIGAQLDMTEGTVKLYLHNVYRKLGLANRTSLALLIAGSSS